MRSFRKFILSSLFFAIFMILLMTIMWKAVTWTRAQLCYNPKAKILVMGNSRIQYGFDDSKIDDTWNVGLNADNYNIIYWKLKTLHRYNPQIQKVVLEVDNALLFNYFKGVEYKLHPYYWDTMDFNDWISLVANDRTILMYPFDWMKILFPIKSVYQSVSFQELGIGGYTILDRDKLQDAIQEEKNKKHEQKIPHINMINDLQLNYLNKIIAYCQSHNIRVEFINMPSYPTKKVKHDNIKLHEHITKFYPSIPFHDYELLILPDSCYGDISHINYKGANALSQFLKKDIKK